MPAHSGEQAKQPIAEAIVALLDADPSLTGKELSTRLGLSVSRLVRVFKAQRGMSIVEYRHRLRFARFFSLVTKEGNPPQTLLQAARIAGFGSYPHFHRLFCARWHKRPRELIGDKTTLAIASAVAWAQGGQAHRVKPVAEPRRARNDG